MYDPHDLRIWALKWLIAIAVVTAGLAIAVMIVVSN